MYLYIIRFMGKTQWEDPLHVLSPPVFANHLSATEMAIERSQVDVAITSFFPSPFRERAG
jgi:hypothetical protein